MNRRAPIVITTFAYNGEPPPVATLTVDTRALFADPRDSLMPKNRTGRYQRVIDRFLLQPGAYGMVTDMANLLSGLSITRDDVTIAIGCADGQVVSVALAECVARRLASHGYRRARQVHRDLRQRA